MTFSPLEGCTQPFMTFKLVPLDLNKAKVTRVSIDIFIIVMN